MFTSEARGVDVGRLYEAQRLSLIRLATLLVDDVASAEDIVHDAFVNLHRRRDGIRDGDAAVGYLRVSVVNGARSALRRRQTARHYLRQGQVAASPAADTESMLAAEEQRVLDILRLLPPRQREVLTLRYWSDFSEAEIAATLDISRGSVKTHASRGMARIQELLGGER